VDKQFLEFWGNLLLSAAKGQRQLDEFSRWMSQGMSGFRDLTAMFQQFYDLEVEKAAGDERWDSARNAFTKAYRAYLDSLGAVPRSEFTALKKQYEELKKTAEDQKATLHRLRMELSESRMAQGDVVRGFQELIQVQSEQFKQVADSFSRFFADQGPNQIERKKP
jgi:hypothetical protein